MEQIEQLKVMRDAAQERLRANPDFKLKNSLDALIDDLESFISGESSGVVGDAVSSDPQDDLVASDDEEEQQSEESYIEPVAENYNAGSRSYDEDQQATSAAEESLNNNQDVEDNDIDDSDIAAALAQNISAEDIHNEQDFNESDSANSSKLDMEAEAAIEALEAELAQSDSDVNRP